MSGLCSSSQIRCEQSHECIFQRYICDGVKDCRDGSDESREKCGLTPCYGKITCQNTKRCIPFNWCCDPRRQETCDQWRMGVCCQFDMQIENSRSSNEGPFTNVLHRKENSRIQIELQNKNSRPASGYLGDPTWGYQSAIFLITGCTLAFICLLLVGSFLAMKLVIRRMKRSRNLVSSTEDEFRRDQGQQVDNVPVERGFLIVSQVGNILNESVIPPPPYMSTGYACVDTDSAPPAYCSSEGEESARAGDPPPAYTLLANEVRNSV